MEPYATPSDLATWMGADQPANAVQLLRRASYLVAKAARYAIYDTDSAGQPTTARVLGALRDATCAQAAAWVAADIDPAGAGVTPAPTVRRRTIDTAAIEYDTAGSGTAQAFEARRTLATGLTDEARDILGAAGLLTAGIVVVG